MCPLKRLVESSIQCASQRKRKRGECLQISFSNFASLSLSLAYSHSFDAYFSMKFGHALPPSPTPPPSPLLSPSPSLSSRPSEAEETEAENSLLIPKRRIEESDAKGAKDKLRSFHLSVRQTLKMEYSHCHKERLLILTDAIYAFRSLSPSFSLFLFFHSHSLSSLSPPLRFAPCEEGGCDAERM